MRHVAYVLLAAALGGCASPSAAPSVAPSAPAQADQAGTPLHETPLRGSSLRNGSFRLDFQTRGPVPDSSGAVTIWFTAAPDGRLVAVRSLQHDPAGRLRQAVRLLPERNVLEMRDYRACTTDESILPTAADGVSLVVDSVGPLLPYAQHGYRALGSGRYERSDGQVRIEVAEERSGVLSGRRMTTRDMTGNLVAEVGGITLVQLPDAAEAARALDPMTCPT